MSLYVFVGASVSQSARKEMNSDWSPKVPKQNRVVWLHDGGERMS